MSSRSWPCHPWCFTWLRLTAAAGPVLARHATPTLLSGSVAPSSIPLQDLDSGRALLWAVLPTPRSVAMAVMTYCILKYKYHLVYIHTLSPAHFMSRSSLSSSRKCDSSLSFLSVPTRRPLTASLPCPPTLLLQEVRFRRELSLLAVSSMVLHLAPTDSSSRTRPRSPCYAHSPLRKCGAIQHSSSGSGFRQSLALGRATHTSQCGYGCDDVLYSQIQIPSCVYSYTIPRALHVAKLTLLLQEVRLLSLLSFFLSYHLAFNHPERLHPHGSHPLRLLGGILTWRVS